MNKAEKVCKVCGQKRCIGKFLLHPKEVNLFVPRIKEEELKVNPQRTFHLVNSPSSGEIFTVFKELHVTAGPNEDLDNLPEVNVYVGDLIEKIRGQNSLPADIDFSIPVGEKDHPTPIIEAPHFEIPEVTEAFIDASNARKAAIIKKSLSRMEIRTNPKNNTKSKKKKRRKKK